MPDSDAALARLRGQRIGEWARYALVAIRVVNGALALLAPRGFVRILGLDPDANVAAVYVLRLFGVRTVYLGLELLLASGEARKAVTRSAVAIHASDTAAAALAGASGALPRRAAATATLASSINTALAVLAARE